ncbi:uncharacterized protein ACB058_014033 [Synchiropus picturatus]
MRFLLATSMVLLLSWLYSAHIADGRVDEDLCKATSLQEATVKLLVSPLSLYCWLSSTLVTLLRSLPALLCSALHHTLLLCLVGPWCVATVCLSLLCTCLHVALYLLHLLLLVGLALLIRSTQHSPDAERRRRKTSVRRSIRTRLCWSS